MAGRKVGPGDVVASRFELEQVAGSGAFGRVFRARDTRTGQVVALKLLEEARAEVAERFEREGALLATVAHANVVRHVASGTEAGRFAYLAMEWLEGEDLARRIARADPLSPRELVDLARAVAAGLSAAHALGIVHRDVKPSNVWLVDRRVDQAKVLDFGLARLAAQSSLTRAGTFLGTPEYMAPEQVKGAASLDERADLFSLGCVLFECAAGRTPFCAPTALAVATRILLDEPPRLDVARSDVPPPFAELVAQLLAKDPDARPTWSRVEALLEATSALLGPRTEERGSDGPEALLVERPALEVSVLEASLVEPGGAASMVMSDASSSARSSTESSLLGRAPPFVGRDGELAALAAAFDGCVRRKAACAVLLEGAAGIGKSRLAREFLGALALRASPLVVVLRGEALRRGEPFGALARATSEALRLPPASVGALALQADLKLALAARLPASHEARVTAFFGELLGAPFVDTAHPLLAAARAEGARVGDQIARAWSDWIDAESQEHPVVLVLDDAPLLDAPSLEAVAGVLRHLRRRRVVVLTIARPGARDGLAEALAGPTVITVQLGPLARAACDAIAAFALGPAVTPSVLAAMAARSAGVPLHLEELVRALAAGADVARPLSIEAMVDARLAGLDAAARGVIEAASVLGLSFDATSVSSLLDLPLEPASIDRLVDRLVALELVSDAPALTGAAGARPLVFRHALVREAAYSAIADDRRAALHARAARWLARTGPWSPVVIAQHLVRAGEVDAARAFYRRAAAVALESNDFAGAIAAAERALESGAEAEELGQLRLLQAEASRHLGENEVMLARSEDALVMLPPWSRPWFRGVALAVLGAIRLGRVAVLDRLEPTLADAARGGGLPAAAARTAHYLFFAGRGELAEELLAATADGDAAGPDRDAWVARACATRALLTGDIATYLDHLEHAIAAFEEVGDLREQAAERVNAGFAQMELGLSSEAEATLRLALESAERTGLRHVEAVARVNLGETLFRADRRDEALASLDAAVGALRRQGNARMEGNACAYRARLHLASGEAEAALRDASCAVERLGHVPPLLPFALAVLASVHLAAGRIAPAGAAAEQAIGRMRAVGRLDEGEAFVLRVAAEVAMAAGNRQAAIELIGEARARLLGRAGRIGRDDWRQSFLGGAEHARALELCAWWTGEGVATTSSDDDGPATVQRLPR